MQNTTQTPFGRSETYVLTPDQAAPTQSDFDKWDLLAALTKAAPDFDLSHRNLTVLKALMTFLPDRDITSEPGSAIVFPSNRTLSDRLNGMPESTLRRHLSQLVTLGIVSRHSSPNGKRFARRVGQGISLAFGFDLSPLARHAQQLFLVAHQADLQQQRLRVLRDHIAALRLALIEAGQGAASSLLEEARLSLRRKPDEATLIALHQQLQEAVTVQCSQQVAAVEETAFAKMSAADSHNERHIQDSIEYTFDSERDAHQIAKASDTEKPKQAKKAKTEADLAQVLNACPEFQSFYPEPVHQWQDLDRVTENLSPMIGIDLPVLQEARAAMGRRQAATVVLCILQRLGDIRSPGAYLRRLTQKARSGQFSVLPMLNALSAASNGLKLSADNPKTC
ncbi:plasmid replication protein RepC [Parasedimentitalea psychrophila]|uniref:Plasmid replication protein RepC n=1 Tax=Parasedimentitalea psychrophila TaxID=2997337 RepID=A0A9Y2P986_9RHOB|nr:plasmid replication protein RepC [Parasedimentitalea psychrophila]WIY27720.1 plasmid replication protein RepC [Parasedimentitalea psychrophila]